MDAALERQLTLGEEIANAITHGVGAVLSVAALVFLVTLAAIRGTTWHIVSCAIYGTTLILAYTSSTLYHSFTGPRVKRVFRILDHCSIYLLIAGTYTPFILISVRNRLGLALLVLIWVVSIAGVIFKSAVHHHDGIVSTTIYVLLGWAALLIIRPLLQAIPLTCFAWVLAGGLSYTAGVIFFASRWRYAHMIWHLFVLAGSICHFVAIAWFLLPKA